MHRSSCVDTRWLDQVARFGVKRAPDHRRYTTRCPFASVRHYHAPLISRPLASPPRIRFPDVSDDDDETLVLAMLSVMTIFALVLPIVVGCAAMAAQR